MYFVSGKAGLGLAFVNASATAVWPPTGIALAAFLLLGSRAWSGVLLGAFFVNLTTAGTVATSAGIAAGNTLEGILGAYLVTRYASGKDAFRQSSDVFKFAALAGGLATTASATIGVTTLALGGFERWSHVGTTWVTWWLGDAAGAVVVAPFLVLWGLTPRISWNRRRAPEAALLWLSLLVVGLCVFGGLAPPGDRHYPLEFLCLPVLIWAAFRFSRRVASTAIVALSGIAIWGTLRGFGPFVRPDPNESLLLLQAFMAVFSMTTLAVTATVSEHRRVEASIRRLNEELEKRVSERTGQLRVANHELRDHIRERTRAEERLRASEARLLEAQQVGRIGSWEWDMERNRVWWSEALYALYGLDPDSFGASYEAFLELVHPDDRDRVHGIVQAAARDAQPFSFEHRIVRPDGTVLTMHARGRVVTDPSGKPLRMMGTGQDISEHKRAEEQRSHLIREQVARREAEQTSRLKDEFLTTLSHELRNPLNAIVGWVHLLREGRLDRETSSRAIEAVHRNAQIQSQLILDLLDLSRLKAGRVELRRQSVDLRTVIEQALDTMRPTALAKGVALHSAADDVAQVSGDPERLQQVVWNLLSNAINHTQEGGRVDVSLSTDDSVAEIRVQDNGRGIPPEVLPHIFDRFRQGDVTAARRHGGLGLGLAIVKQLVELHGGSVRAANRHGGQGAVCTVTLPLSRAAGQRGEVQSPISAPAYGALRGVRVLVVDDDPDARELLTVLMTGRGAEVVSAGSGAEALSCLRSSTPDVLITDIEMPSQNGYELLAEVRRLPGAGVGSVPAIALTAYAGAHHAERAMRSGFQAHVAKPFEPDELVKLVEGLVQGAPVRG
ncbi:MAG TPA: MASE1 domain-containing protein [Candidatus Eisenbacteria bacterium]